MYLRLFSLNSNSPERNGDNQRTMSQTLSVFMGSAARSAIAENGWRGAPITTVIGASGGPKWLILSELDQVLASELLIDNPRTITLLGSSIGTWRHACLSQPDPVDAIKRLQRAYLGQEYSSPKPTPREVSNVAGQILGEALGQKGAQNLIHHPTLHNAIVTARAKGIARGQQGLSLVAGMAAATLSNAWSRAQLERYFQRVIFCHPGLEAAPFASGFDTEKVSLTENNLIAALKASGAIPLLMQCEPHIPGAGAGPLWDGGIIDYHFTLDHPTDTGLVLYPHFSPSLNPGLFDKKLRHRTQSPRLSNLILICPSDDFLASLPFGKIPDRGDFRAMSPEQRIPYWEVCIRESSRLAEAFYDLITGDDPLQGVTPL